MKAYLEKLIKVLDEEDISKIKAIALKTSKLKVFLNYLIQIRTDKEMLKPALIEYLRVDDKMLRKMKSVLLRKCYIALAPNDGLELLDILSRYRLVENFKRELLFQENRIKNQPIIEVKRKFYESAITYLLRLPFSTLSTDELDHYSEINLKFSKDNGKELLALFHAVRILVIRMIQVYYKREKKEMKNDSFRHSIEMIEKGSEKFKDESLMAMTLYCKALYSYWVDMDFVKAEKLFVHLISKKNYFNLLPDDFANSVNGFYATILYQINKFDAAISVFEKYKVNKNPFFYNQPHLLSRLCELYIINGRMVEAKELLDKQLNRFLESGEEDAIQITSITYTKYYMFTGDMPKAFEYLQIGRQHLNKKFYLIYDIEIRTLELIYFILSDDMKFSRVILSRTLKFLREKVKTKDLLKHIENHELLNKICRAKTKNRPLIGFVEIVKKQFDGFDTIYYLLLKRYCLEEGGINK